MEEKGETRNNLEGTAQPGCRTPSCGWPRTQPRVFTESIRGSAWKTETHSTMLVGWFGGTIANCAFIPARQAVGGSVVLSPIYRWHSIGPKFIRESVLIRTRCAHSFTRKIMTELFDTVLYREGLRRSYGVKGTSIGVGFVGKANNTLFPGPI